MTLHIIGNGFDSAHKMKTGYEHFCDYAWKHSEGNEYYLGLLETVYPNTNFSTGRLELWSNLEKALGEPDFKAAFDETTDDIELEEGHEGRYQAEKEDAPTYFLQDMFSSFHKLFNRWVESIQISKKPLKLPEFDPHGMFFSFNYTETLEVLYKIPREKINYIHGRRNSGEELIVGHCNDIYGRDYLPEEPMIYEYQAYDNIAAVINDERKKVSEILAFNIRYWPTLSEINKIVIYGHSLSEVDLPYYYKIIEHIQPDTEWFFSIHYDNPRKKEYEVMKVKNFIKGMGLDENRCHTFQM